MAQDSGVSEPGEIQAVSRAAQILGLFAPDTPEITAAAVATSLRMNRTTAYRYCTSLVSAGLLERGKEQGTFVPGALLLQLGAYAIGRRKVLDLAPPHMRALAARAQTTSVLSLWGSAGPVVFRVEEDVTRTVLVTVRVGTHLPIDAAQAKVFMAFHNDQQMVARLLAHQPNAARASLLTEIDSVREFGYSVVSTADGVLALAVPVFDEYGICATLALIGTEATLSGTESPERSMLVATARELTKEMGGSYPTDRQ